MGAWGYKLYQCDEARDIKDAFKDIKNYPFSEDQFLNYFELNLDDLEKQDFDQTIACLSVYDQLHQYGIDAPRLKKSVQRIIEDGIDIQVHRDLDMSERDLEKRAKHLDELWSTWKAPHPKPKRRKPLDPNAPFFFDVGDVVLFPTEKGWPRMDRQTWWECKYLDDSLKGRPAPNINPDGWGAFVVLDQAKIDKVIPRYLILRIAFDPPMKKPDIDDVKNAYVAGNKCSLPLHDAYGSLGSDDNTLFVSNAYSMFINEQIDWLDIVKADLKFLSLEKIGNISLDKDRILTDLHRFQIDMNWCHRHAAWQSASEEHRSMATPPKEAPDYSIPYYRAELNPREKKTLDGFLFAKPYPGKDYDLDEVRRDWKSNGQKIGIIPIHHFPLKSYVNGQGGAPRKHPFCKPEDLISYLPTEPYLYGSKLARKIADEFHHLEGFAFDPDGLIEVFKKHAPQLVFNEETAPNIFLFVMLDRCHLYNIDAPHLFEQAKDLILNGKDEQAYRDLGMDEEDLSIRREDLKAHLERWSVPHPNPLPRTCIDPENPFDFEVGDIIVFQTRNGFGYEPADPNNPYGPTPEEWEATFEKEANGWGAALLVDRAVVNGFDDQYKAVRLFVEGAKEPSFEDVKNGYLAVDRWCFERGHDVDSIFDQFVVRTLKLRAGDLPTYRAKKLGNLGSVFDAEALRQDLKASDENQFNEMRALVAEKLEEAKRTNAPQLDSLEYDLEYLDRHRNGGFLSSINFEFHFDGASDFTEISKGIQMCEKLNDPRAGGLRPDTTRPLAKYFKE